MGRNEITRRDFLDGVAVSAAGLAAAAASPYLTGAEAMIRGHAATARGPLPADAHRHRRPAQQGGQGLRGHRRPAAARTTSTRRTAARASRRTTRATWTTTTTWSWSAPARAASPTAKWYQDRFGPDARILLIDSLPDFGGHSHRNEFHIPDASNGGADVMILRNGGTVNLDSIGAWNQPQGGPARHPGLLRAAGRGHARVLRRRPRTPSRAPPGPGIPSTYGAAVDAALPGRGLGAGLPRAGQAGQPVVAGLPGHHALLAAGAGRDRPDDDRRPTTDWIALQGRPEDRPGEEGDPGPHDLQAVPRWTTSALNEEATGYLQRTSHGLFARRHPVQRRRATRGRSATRASPGWASTTTSSRASAAPPSRTACPTASPTRAWPDGNTSLLRLLREQADPERDRRRRRRAARRRTRSWSRRPTTSSSTARPTASASGSRARWRRSRRARRSAGATARAGGRRTTSRRSPTSPATAEPAGRARARPPRGDGVLEPGHRPDRRRAAARPGQEPLTTPARRRSSTAASACATGRRSPTPRSPASARAATACSGTARPSAPAARFGAVLRADAEHARPAGDAHAVA